MECFDLARVFGKGAGYGLGILFLVPLGDTRPRRSLIITQQLVLAAALVVAALAPSLTVLTLACAMAGAFATTAQQAIPFAAELAPPEARGRWVGFAMTGLLLGILLARTVSGTIADAFGWRIVFAAAAGIALAFAALATVLLPLPPFIVAIVTIRPAIDASPGLYADSLAASLPVFRRIPTRPLIVRQAAHSLFPDRLLIRGSAVPAEA